MSLCVTMSTSTTTNTSSDPFPHLSQFERGESVLGQGREFVKVGAGESGSQSGRPKRSVLALCPVALQISPSEECNINDPDRSVGYTPCSRNVRSS